MFVCRYSFRAAFRFDVRFGLRSTSMFEAEIEFTKKLHKNLISCGAKFYFPKTKHRTSNHEHQFLRAMALMAFSTMAAAFKPYFSIN